MKGKSKMTTHEDLIRDLVAEAEPVNPMSNNTHFLIWFLIAFFSISAGLFFVGLRYDFKNVSMSMGFILETLFALGVTILATAAAFSMSIPGSQSSLNKWMALPLLGWFLTIVIQWFTGNYSFWDGLQGFKCTGEVIALGIIPGFTLFYYIRKAAPLELGKIGLISFLAVFSSGALAVKFTCYFDHPIHLLAFHYLPIFALGGVGYFLGKQFLRW